MDGIDAALIKTDGETIEHFGPTCSSVFKPAQQALLMAAVEVARTMKNRHARPAVMAEAEEFITTAHSEVVVELMSRENLASDDIDVIGFHGQTVFHKPEAGVTIQLGDGARLASLTGIDVVCDFRAADMAAGGQGAPFAPVFHRAMLQYSGSEGASVCVNIGGLSNITWISESGEMIAFDTGPGNVLLDAWCQRHLNQPFDRDGMLSSSGTVNEGILKQLLDNPWFRKPPPKSLDKTDFDLGDLDRLSAGDGAATLAAFTAQTIASSLLHMPKTPKKWIISGGGRHNCAIMRELRLRIGPTVIRAEDAGFNGDDIEAQAFGFLAVRSLRGLPLSFPRTTGVPVPTQGGVVYRHNSSVQAARSLRDPWA